MQKHSDEALVAYLDGELDGDERAPCRGLARRRPGGARPAAGAGRIGGPRAQRLRRYRQRAGARAADRGGARRDRADGRDRGRDRHAAAERGRSPPPAPSRRWQIQLAAAAGLFGLVVGVGAGYLGNGILIAVEPRRPSARSQTAALNNWLDNAAGDYKLMVNAGGNTLVDVPASGDNGDALQKISQNLPQQVRLPDLKPWGLTFQGARLVVVDGRPGGAARLHHRQQGDRAADADHRLDQAARHPADPRPAAGRSTCSTGAIRAAPRCSSARAISATSGASPTTSPGSSTRSDIIASGDRWRGPAGAIAADRG